MKTGLTLPLIAPPRPDRPALTALPAAASGPGEGADHSGDTIHVGAARMTHDISEASVPHVDPASCPVQSDPDAVLCRMTLAAEMANIFVFSIDGDQPLLAIKPYAPNSDFLPSQARPSGLHSLASRAPVRPAAPRFFLAFPSRPRLA